MNNKEIEFNWSKRSITNQKQPSDQKGDITHPFPKHYTPFELFSGVANLDKSAKIIVEQNNLYAQQNGREFQTN